MDPGRCLGGRHGTADRRRRRGSAVRPPAGPWVAPPRSSPRGARTGSCRWTPRRSPTACSPAAITGGSSGSTARACASRPWATSRCPEAPISPRPRRWSRTTARVWAEAVEPAGGRTPPRASLTNTDPALAHAWHAVLDGRRHGRRACRPPAGSRPRAPTQRGPAGRPSPRCTASSSGGAWCTSPFRSPSCRSSRTRTSRTPRTSARGCRPRAPSSRRALWPTTSWTSRTSRSCTPGRSASRRRGRAGVRRHRGARRLPQHSGPGLRQPRGPRRRWPGSGRSASVAGRRTSIARRSSCCSGSRSSTPER